MPINCSQIKSILIMVIPLILIKILSDFINRSQFEFFAIFVIIWPFLAFIILNCIYEHRKELNLMERPPRVEIRDKILFKEIGCFDAFIERQLLGKTIKIKNDPRGNTILFKAISSISLTAVIVIFLSYFAVAMIFSKMTLDVGKDLTFHNIFIGYFTIGATINGLYLFEANKLKEKWNYLSQRYNNIIESRDYDPPVDPMCTNTLVLLNAWAIDALMLTMWGHRSFSELFYNESLKAVMLIDNSRKHAIRMLQTSHFSEDELQFILENYQFYLMSYPHLDQSDAVDILSKGKWLKGAKEKLNAKRP